MNDQEPLDVTPSVWIRTRALDAAVRSVQPSLNDVCRTEILRRANWFENYLLGESD